MAKKLKFAKQEEVKGTPQERAAIILRNSGGDKPRAMDYCAAMGDREALEVINPAPKE